MKERDFFEQEKCDRCNNSLKARTTSWFNTETICVSCSMWENVIIDNRKESKAELESVGAGSRS